MPLADLTSLVQAQHWLPLILTLTLIARRWTAPDSKFPLNLAPQWRPVVTALGGLVYGLVSSLNQGTSWGTALLAMAASAGAGGFADGLLLAIFNKNNAPKWARAIVFVFDDLTGVSSDLPKEPPQKAVSIKPPTAARTGFAVASLGLTLVGCAALSGEPNLPSDIGGAVSCVIADVLAGKPADDCVAKWGAALVNDAINLLMDSKAFAAEHPDLVPKLQEHHDALARKIQ